ncbi:MAG: hypothetical protein D6679_03345 [Candidatus Hydrogenedentota bacterium]|nr:MAG: hypothetical protein D6679_03345 [Candidatus Hydrogenedentota bacterium]
MSPGKTGGVYAHAFFFSFLPYTERPLFTFYAFRKRRSPVPPFSFLLCDFSMSSVFSVASSYATCRNPVLDHIKIIL